MAGENSVIASYEDFGDLTNVTQTITELFADMEGRMLWQLKVIRLFIVSVLLINYKRMFRSVENDLL